MGSNDNAVMIRRADGSMAPKTPMAERGGFRDANGLPTTGAEAARVAAEAARPNMKTTIGRDENGMLTNIQVPAQPLPTAAPAAAPAAVDPLADIKAKDAAILARRTTPTSAGITPSMVQKPTVTAATPGAGSFIQVGSKRLDASGTAGAGFGMSEVNRLAEVSRSNARDAFTRDKMNEDRATRLMSDATALSAQSTAPGGRDLFDASFVGKANMNNPSFRTAMLNQSTINARAADKARNIAALQAEAAGLSKTPVGGQAYNSAGDLSKANVDKLIADANLSQATAAAGGKGTAKNKNSAVDDVEALAKLDPVRVAQASNERALINAGARPKTYRVSKADGSEESLTGLATADQLTGLERDKAELAASQAAYDNGNIFTNTLNGRKATVKRQSKAFRDKLSDMGFSTPSLVAAK